MYGPRVFASMIGALLVFAVATYAMSGAFWATVFQTVLCAILLQVGYFIGVLFMVWKTARDGRSAGGEISSKAGDAEKPSTALPVSRFNKTGPSNF